MGHVDALSRCYGIHILEANNFDRIMSLKQMQDPKILEIRGKLENSEEKFFELTLELPALNTYLLLKCKQGGKISK